MPAPDSPNSHAAKSGLRGSLDSLKIQLARYCAARLALFRVELGEAGQSLGKRLQSLLLGGVLLVFGYLLLLAGLLGFAEHYHAGSWPIAAVILAATHLAAGIPLVRAASRKPEKPLFEESLNQIKKDEQWMRQMSHRSEQNPPQN